MKKQTSILSTSTGFDKKCKLNRFNEKVPSTYLDLIEKGVTIEQLDKMAEKGMPIFKYQTQITIHGIFDQLETFSIQGYRNLFQNKNKSIGIKYNAIDESKRQVIKKRLQVLGITYQRDSKGTRFVKSWNIDKENYDTTLNQVKELAAKFDEKLFIGFKQIWIGENWGAKFLIFEIFVNAIYEKNVNEFCTKAGATIEAMEILEAKDRAKELERKNEWDKERAKKIEIQKTEKLKHQSNLDALEKKYKRHVRTSAIGIYVEPKFNYDDTLVYQVSYVYDIAGKKKPRFNRRSFDTMNEAMSHTVSSKYDDSILKGSVTGYKI